MSDDISRKRRAEHQEWVRSSFPEGVPRLDLLCQLTAQFLDCDFGAITLNTDKGAFAAGAYNLPQRWIGAPSEVPSGPVEALELMTVPEEVRCWFYPCEHEASVEYLVLIPMEYQGTNSASLCVGSKDLRTVPLSDSQFSGLQTAAQLGEKILTRSEALKLQLASLVNVMVI